MKKALGNAKMTDSDVRGMKARIATGQSTVKQEAMRFHVARETIRRAYRGETFEHLVKEEMVPEAKIQEFNEELKDEVAASLNKFIEMQRKEKKEMDPVAAKRMREFGILPPELVAPPPEDDDLANPLEEK
jgi:hypothetical protein